MLPQAHPAALLKAGVAYKGSSRTLESPVHESLLTVSQCSLGRGGRQNLERNVDRRHLRCRATALDLVVVGILEAVHAQSGLGLVPGICLLPAQGQAEKRSLGRVVFP